jgi:hypothetical protein
MVYDKKDAKRSPLLEEKSRFSWGFCDFVREQTSNFQNYSTYLIVVNPSKIKFYSKEWIKRFYNRTYAVCVIYVCPKAANIWQELGSGYFDFDQVGYLTIARLLKIPDSHYEHRTGHRLNYHA